MSLRQRLQRLGTDLQRRLRRPIVDQRQGLGLDEQVKARRLEAIAMEAHERFEHSREMSDINSAVQSAQLALKMTPENSSDRPAFLSNLGVFLESRFEQTGELDDLEEAIRVARGAIKSTIPDDHPDRASFLNNLGTKLESRYEWSGDMHNLEEAISLARQAIKLTPDGHPAGAGRLNNLGSKLAKRFSRLGGMDDLEEAIRVTKQAIATPNDDPERADWLNSLGNRLASWFDRKGDMNDLEDAITVTRQAIKLTPNEAPNQATWLGNLGNKLQSRYRWTDDMGDLEEAINSARRAVELTPDNHPDRAGWLNNLGTMLQSRYERLSDRGESDRDDLEVAITVTRQAVKSIPNNHPNRAILLYNLGTKLLRQYTLTREDGDLENALSTLQDAWRCQTATPFDRIRAGAQCLKLLYIQQKNNRAMRLGKDMIDFLPTVNTRLLDLKDQQFVVSTFANVAADLCALLLKSGQATDALHYLERGRAVIIGQLVDARSDPSSLAQQHPDIAHRYEQLRDEVNKPHPRVETGVVDAHLRKRRVEAVAELDACILEIRRNYAGHERFLLGQTIAEMQKCAIGGSIAIINVSEFRSDAIIVTPIATKTFNLPRLAAEDAKIWLDKNWKGRTEEKLSQKNKEYLRYLAWLWETCVERVLTEVSACHDEAGDLPRVWWIGSGLASSMPFHAAGIYSADSTEDAYSRVLSSYTPSVKALGYAQHRATVTASLQGSLLVAAMPTTPRSTYWVKFPDLPGVVDEKKLVEETARGHLTIEDLDLLPSVEQVVDKLRYCLIAHFACHGVSDQSDPSNSGLVLQRRDGGALNRIGSRYGGYQS